VNIIKDKAAKVTGRISWLGGTMGDASANQQEAEATWRPSAARLRLGKLLLSAHASC
jgi:hypothetical protein